MFNLLITLTRYVGISSDIAKQSYKELTSVVDEVDKLQGLAEDMTKTEDQLRAATYFNTGELAFPQMNLYKSYYYYNLALELDQGNKKYVQAIARVRSLIDEQHRNTNPM